MAVSPRDYLIRPDAGAPEGGWRTPLPTLPALFAAAYAAGALTLPQAARVAALRARAVRRLPAGAMAAVALPAQKLAALLAGRSGPPLAVAAENAPRASVVAGDPDAVGALPAELGARGVRARRIAVDYASHCAAVEPLEAELTEAPAGLEPAAVSTPFLSTAGAGWLSGPELTADHWYRNLRSPVLFGPAVETLLEAGLRTFVELGPHPVLAYAVQETAGQPGAAAFATGSLRRGEGGVRRFLLSAAEAYVHGAEVDWAAAYGDRGRAGPRAWPAGALPTYPFRRRRYWLADRRTDRTDRTDSRARSARRLGAAAECGGTAGTGTGVRGRRARPRRRGRRGSGPAPPGARRDLGAGWAARWTWRRPRRWCSTTRPYAGWRSTWGSGCAASGGRGPAAPARAPRRTGRCRTGCRRCSDGPVPGAGVRSPWRRWPRPRSCGRRSPLRRPPPGPCCCAGTPPAGGPPGPWPSGSRSRAVRRPASY
ncbi:acyltransferase domain-containing protein [Streptomyces sp. NPDC046866]|uniref:acyltransferase domain-containing protein n=1 Tax=Streptomyces sp. NPDC046866 TaxID=3154921 RepID=UPI003455D328